MNNPNYLASYHSVPKRCVRAVVRNLLLRPAVALLLRTEITGVEHLTGLPKSYILIGNHTSHLDAPMVFGLLPESAVRRLAAGAAADYFYTNSARSWLTSLFFNTYPVDRKGKTATKHVGHAGGMTAALLRSGVPVLLFPEGTRSRDGKLGQFHPGAAALAAKLNIPLVPLALRGGQAAMPVGRKFPKLNRPPVSLQIGEPLYARPGESAPVFMERARAQIVQLLQRETPDTAAPDSVNG
ncbi:MAG: lysophospholipid acyltransferase family protein [Trueperella sp.]|nr:lysophospholipid acyltransferase family protein [Trueperella sp.]